MSDQLDLRKTYKAIVEAAREGRFISYGDLARANSAPWHKVRYEMNTHLGELVRVAASRDWPMLSAIVVNQNNLESGTLDGSARDGFIAAAKENGFTIDDPAAFVEQQQNALFEWASGAPDELALDKEESPSPAGLGGPRFVAFFTPVLEALRNLGGTAEPKAVYEEVAKRAEVPAAELAAKNKNGLSRFENQIGWARFYLAKAGLIENRKRGLWQLTPEGRETQLDHASALALFREIHERFKTAATDAEEDAAPAEDETDIEVVAFDPYGINEIVDDGCFLAPEALHVALERLRVKKNLILQGPPGTGKTWLAKRLGYALIGTRDSVVTRKRMRAIQFHPSLSYEDFVRGWRPDGNGQLALIDGVFLEAVEAARAERDLAFVVIIEEINRGNPAQVFGEMLTLLENDKRREEEGIELAYRQKIGERIYIPDNLYVIGTMNIADRSLALVDLALRRRFAFVNLETALNERWRRWCYEHAGIDEATLDEIQRRMTALNDEIGNDRSLGAQFRIGHSYVTPGRGEQIQDAWAWFGQVVETEIGPLLEEYWFDNLGKAAISKSKLLEGP